MIEKQKLVDNFRSKHLLVFDPGRLEAPSALPSLRICDCGATVTIFRRRPQPQVPPRCLRWATRTWESGPLSAELGKLLANERLMNAQLPRPKLGQILRYNLLSEALLYNPSEARTLPETGPLLGFHWPASPIPLPNSPGSNSLINHLHVNLLLRVGFWRT